jgi:hypothetical protein
MIELPKYDQRTTVIGSTGTGKTVLAVWLLSTRDWLHRPWTILDFKRDELIAQLNAQEIDVRKPPPDRPGLYVVRPDPRINPEYITQYLWQVWQNEHHGLFIDEGTMLSAHDPALTACLNQGRSKGIEMIILTQRPVKMNKSVFSEANNFAVMRLNILDDRKLVTNYLGGRDLPDLPKHHSLWYSADKNESAIMLPVPYGRELVGRFQALEQLPRRQLI